MKRFVLAVIAIALPACSALASEPKSDEVAKAVKRDWIARPISAGEEVVFPPPQFLPMPPKRPLHVRLIEFVECPIKPIVEYVRSPNSQLRRLLNESEDLRKAREQFQRFWISSTSRPF